MKIPYIVLLNQLKVGKILGGHDQGYGRDCDELLYTEIACNTVKTEWENMLTFLAKCQGFIG